MHSISIKKNYLTIPKNFVICFQSSAIRYHFSRFRSITIKYHKQCSFHTANAGQLTNGKTVNFDIFYSAPSVLFRRIAVQFNNPRSANQSFKKDHPYFIVIPMVKINVSIPTKCVQQWKSCLIFKQTNKQKLGGESLSSYTVIESLVCETEPHNLHPPAGMQEKEAMV